MKRMKRHKIKQEMPETSTSRFREQEEHDLAYYIHDRVELMHQVFSVIKPKELRAMAPECVHHISIDDLQELCTEELLGISSKRLCAILDGADPPTDTESSSSEHNMETISLDSISSDDEVLSQHSAKRKHKHRKHKSKNKHKRKNSKSSDKEQGTGPEEDEERSKASRAGLTVLELLELQARARAIRAQLQQDNAREVPTQPQPTESKTNNGSSEDEVEIKEEPAEVVEISSEDEKPNVKDLPVKPPSPSKDQLTGNSKTVTKRINDLIVTVPQSKQTKKIVLNRNKSVTSSQDTSKSSEVSKTKDAATTKSTNDSKTTTTKIKPSTSTESSSKIVTRERQEKIKGSEANHKVQSKLNSNKSKKKQKKKDRKSDKEEDHDEITLQLSDTEKMDLLEDLDRKNYENFTSSSEDSESSSESESENDTSQDSTVISQYNNAPNSENNKVEIISQERCQTDSLNVISEETFTKSEKYILKVDGINQEETNVTTENMKDIPKIDGINQEETNVTTENIKEVEKDIPKVDGINQKETNVTTENIKKVKKDISKVSGINQEQTNDTTENIIVEKKPEDTIYSNQNLKDTIDSKNAILNVDLASGSPKRTTYSSTVDIAPFGRQEANQSSTNPSDKSLIVNVDSSKRTDIEIDICKTAENVSTVVDNQNAKSQVIETNIILVKNDNFTESNQTEPQQTMRSVIVAVEHDKTVEPSTGDATKDTEKTKQIRSSVENVNEDKMRVTDKNDSIDSIEEGEITNTNKDLSEGEITDNEQEEAQTNNTKSPDKTEVVSVSDDENEKKRKKKKKKDKKSKKEKKSKKTKSDFREGADQNFFREEEDIVIIGEEFEEREENNEKDNNIVLIAENSELNQGEKEVKSYSTKENMRIADDIVSLDEDDDIYEILEISDDSSCYEVEGISVSKEPTVVELAALSAKIDEIQADDVIVINEEDGDEDNGEFEKVVEENSKFCEDIENISWHDRYLGSKKVKRVLTTSNILNALRKKNKELKSKLDESKKKIKQVTEGDKKVLANISEFVEGSIEHFNTLQGSTKYVDPVVPEVAKESIQADENKESKETEVEIKEVTKEMEKDAKQLLKMYKRLLKYNDINKKKDPAKKKKKKHKKNKEKETSVNVIINK